MANQFKPIAPDIASAEDLACESRRSATAGRFCERCNRPLDGKKERFCSARCRTAVHRKAQANELTNLIETLSETVAALQTLVGGRS